VAPHGAGMGDGDGRDAPPYDPALQPGADGLDLG
jgi:hypothetical protein